MKLTKTISGTAGSSNGFALVLAFAALSATALAQTTTPPACAAPATAATALNIEQVLNLSNGVLATQAPPAPTGVVNGTQEIHQSFVLDPGSATISALTFLVAKGSPTPTNLSTITAANTLQVGTYKVNQIMAGTTPAPSLMVLATTVNGPPGGFPSSVGTPVVLTMGYTPVANSGANTINNFALVVAGQVVAWSPAASGTLTLGYPPAGTVPAYCTGK